MNFKTRIFFLFSMLYAMVQLRAQMPFVYNKENTGAHFPLPTLPALSELPVIDPLPDPFLWFNGKGRSTKFNDWERHRNEIKASIEHYEIGIKPQPPQQITASFSKADSVLTVIVTEKGKTLTLTCKIILPAGPGPFPAIIGMNSPSGSLPADIFASRQVARIRYNHNQVTTYNAPKKNDPYYELYPELWGASGQYSAWAWGVSRIIDGLALTQSTLPVDLGHLAVTGCSYAGKMALFAGALDERIALTIAQESGGGGGAAWRVSETIGNVEKLGATSNQWFRQSMFAFSGLNVSRLPHDHHELMAMIAPRALLVTGNTDYEWLANPSCYVSARAAKEVYKTLGISERMGFYIDGKHGHCAIPGDQRPAIEAFVDKFLLDKKQVITDTVTVHPYPDLDYKSWYSWWGKAKPSLGTQGRVNIWLEAECGLAGTNWKTVADPSSSNGKYVVPLEGLNSTQRAPKDTSANLLVLHFTLAREGYYQLLAKVNGANATQDSYWYRIDDRPFETANGFTGDGHWVWGRLAGTQLAAGPHSISFTYREPNAKLDKILITDSRSSLVVQEEKAGNGCP